MLLQSYLHGRIQGKESVLPEMNKEGGTTLIAVTHSIDFARLMENVFRLQNGVLENFVTR